MKRCPQCGAASTRPGEKFCARCGATLTEAPAPEEVTWPPQAAIRRRRRMIAAIVAGVAAVVVLAGVLIWLVAARANSRTQPVEASAPADSTAEVTSEPAPTQAPVTAALGEEKRLYLENLPTAPGMRITVDGQETPWYTAEDGRFYIDRTVLGESDTLLRAIVPSGAEYQTSLALVSKPSNPTASFGTLTTCEEDGYNNPDGEYLDAMLSVYYRSMLKAYNSRKVSDLRFSTDLNDQSWTEAITMGAYDAVEYDLAQSDMGFTTTGLGYGDHKVTLNVFGKWVGVNRTSGQTETGTDYMTIQAIWQDGIWQIDRCLPCTEADFNNGTLQLSTN